jgi:hypothetical protein
VLARVNGRWYDPSSGKDYADLASWENAWVQGYYVSYTSNQRDEAISGVDLNGDGDAADLAVPTGMMMMRQNPVGLDVEARSADY